MHPPQVKKNIDTWMSGTADQINQDETMPMVLLAYKELGKGMQSLMIYKGAEYTNDQVIGILQAFIDNINKSKQS